MTVRAYRLSTFEISCGLVFGPGNAMPPLPESSAEPRAAFERSIAAALERPPCLVSFSGGRDSSTVLTLAARVARREGLPLPIPATQRFPGVTSADETAWQERVVSGLGLADWWRREVRGELDCVGPVARDALRRHGLLWPFNAYFHLPIMRAASGGSLLTGVFGDEVLGPSRWARASAVLAARVRPRPRDALRVGLALAPRPLRARVIRRRMDVSFPWLTPDTQRAVLRAFCDEEAGEPVGWRAGIDWWRGLRYSQLAAASLAILAADHDIRLVHPFADAAFLAALAELPRARRFGGRTEALHVLFGDQVDATVLARSTKASFDGVFFGPQSRAFTARWEGTGADSDHVDVEALRRHWRSGTPDGRSFLLVQAAWLAAHAGRRSLPRRREAVRGSLVRDAPTGCCGTPRDASNVPDL